MKKINKDKISDAIFIIIIAICFYIFISSIVYLTNASRKYSFYDESMISKIKTDMKDLENNIDKISKLDNSIYTKEELKQINSNLNIIYKELQKSYEITTTNKKFSLREISASSVFSVAPYIKIIEIIEEKIPIYSEFKDYVKASQLKSFINNRYIILELSSLINIPYNFDTHYMLKHDFYLEIRTAKSFTDIVLKAGDYNEK